MADSNLTPTEKLLSQVVNSVTKLTERIDAIEKGAKELSAKVAESMKPLSESVTTLIDGQVKIETKMKELEEKKVVESKPQESERGETFNDAPPAIVSAVREVLDKRFSVKVKEYQPGFSYELEIIPPEVLKEFAEDRRVYVVHYSEGTDGARRAAEKVKKFCQAWAIRNGVSYDKGL